ncbi:MAG: recombinase XerC [Gemmatimonadota bacterium]|nr:MAG: recombinase XerC [Gemmatimonadota bacterium]
MQILEALDEYLVQLEADGRSPHTISQYRRHVRLLADWSRTHAATADISAVTHQLLARFLASPLARTRPDGRTKKATAMNALRTSLRVFFSYLHEAGYIDQNPARLIRRAVCSPPPPRAFTDDEQKRLLARFDKAGDDVERRDRTLFTTMLTTGIRIGSAVALDVSDIDLDAGELWVRIAKRDAPERVLIPEKTVAMLREWIGDRKDEALFPGANGRRITTRHAARRFARWCAVAGITRATGTHALRHSFGQRVYERTGDILLVKTAMRHRSVASTIVYSVASRSRTRAAIEDR